MMLPLPKQRRAALLIRKLTGYVRIGFALVFIAGLAVACTANDPGDQTASSSSSGMVQCESVWFGGGRCDECVYKECCSELSACAPALNCLVCANAPNPDEPKCDASYDLSRSLRLCWAFKCECECSGHPNMCGSSSASSSSGSGGTGGASGSSSSGSS
jgi:hypothetical protein